MKFKIPTCLTALLVLSLCPSSFGEEVKYFRPWTVDPTADDGKVKILMLGHSFFLGAQDDLQGILPAMLAHQKGWDVDLDSRWSQGGWASNQILVDEGYHTLDEFLHTSETEGWTEIKAMITNQQHTGVDEHGNPYVYDPPAGSGDYDFILFLNGTGPGAESSSHGNGMMSERNYARAMHALDPTAAILGLMVWGEPSFDFAEHAASADISVAAWRAAAGAESEAPKIWDLQVGSKKVTWDTLKTIWDQTGNIDKFVSAPVAEAWKLAYAERGIGNIVLHRSIINDDNHGNLWGDYLKTCVFFSMMTGEKFDGRGYSETLVSAGNAKAEPEEQKYNLPDDIARYFEDVAWRIVQREYVAMDNLLNGREIGVPEIVPGETLIERVIERAFDDQGRVYATRTLNGDESTGPYERTQYDAEGRVSRRESLAPDGTVLAVRVFTPVIVDGKLIENEHRDGEGTYLGKDIYTYHPDSGLKASEKFQDASGGVDATYEFDYFPDGKPREERFYNAAGQLELTTVHSYDGQGRLQQSTATGANTGIVETTTYTYGSSHADQPSTKDTTTTGLGSPTRTRYEYDAEGRLDRVQEFRIDPDTSEEIPVSDTDYRNFDHPIGDWSSDHGASLDPLSDDDNDGALLIAEFVADTLPNNAASRPELKPIVVQSGGQQYAALEFLRRTNLHGLTAEPEICTTLGTGDWQNSETPPPGGVTLHSSTPDSDRERMVYRGNNPLSEVPTQFFRLRFSAEPSSAAGFFQ